MRLPGITEPIADASAGSDDWYTPPHIFDALKLRFDCDPASPEGGVPWIPVDHYHTELEDGLVVPWHGRVWMNPPYSAPGPWLERLRVHGNGIGLVAGDTSTGWWHENVPSRASVVCFLRNRVRFLRDNGIGTEKTGARFPSALIAYGEDNAQAVKDSGLGWCVTDA